MKKLVSFQRLAGIAVLVLLLPAAGQAQPPSTRGQLVRGAAASYRQRARFPETSRALAAGEVDPIRADRTPAPHSLQSPRGEQPVLTLWPEEVSFEAPAPVDLHFTMTAGRPGAPAPQVASVTGEVVSESGEVVGRVTYADDGRGADRRTGDGVFSARFSMPPGRTPVLAESLLVKVRARTADGVEHLASSGFLYSRPTAHLTGRYRDAVVDGSLVVGAEVEVTRSGRYHLAATLYSTAGESVGWAQNAAELAPGRHWLELSYYGLIFHDRGAAGPYRLGSVALATTTGMPNALNTLVENAYRTHAYRLERFTAVPFDDPSLLRAADRLDAEAGISGLPAAP